MLTRVTIKNFKRLQDVCLDLDSTVILIGPNNSGKTSALQALALWEAGLRAWLTKRSTSDASKRSGVTINRKDLIALSVPHANLLWRDLHVRTNLDGKTSNILIEILVEGTTRGQSWVCGLEFDYANPESFYCRPLRKDPDAKERYSIPDSSLVQEMHMAFLPAMSGLASVEPRSERGRINVLIGEGQTAQVLRNLCFDVYTDESEKWSSLVHRLAHLFGVTLLPPVYLSERGEIQMSYRDRKGVELDLSSAGRGLQQTLLLLSYLYSNPGSVLLLDEPDAHLEILRQREVYNLLQEVSRDQGSQIVAASHSEVILNEAVERDSVIAFLGKPHVVDRSQQLLKSLKEYGFEHYYQAEARGWVLYLEGSTDLKILQAWARVVGHPVSRALEAPFVHYLQTNSPRGAEEHFYALQEAVPSLQGVVVLDRISTPLKDQNGLRQTMWSSREIENYLALRKVILRYIAGSEPPSDDMFAGSERLSRIESMEQCLAEIEQAQSVLGKPSVWSSDIKATDDFLEPLFARYADRTKTPIVRKARFYELASSMESSEVVPEIIEKLDAIWAVAQVFQELVDA